MAAARAWVASAARAPSAAAREAATLQWLEKGYKERADCMAWAGTDPKLDNMRGDARFEDLLQRIGLSRQRQGAIRK